MRAYARQAQDAELIGWAAEIKKRAERRAGQLLVGMAERRERAAPGEMSHGVTLPVLGITRMQSSRWQRLAEMNEPAFEQHVKQIRRTAERSVEGTAAERTAAKFGRHAEAVRLGKLDQ
jgi:hypothetical protein